MLAADSRAMVDALRALYWIRLQQKLDVRPHHGRTQFVAEIVKATASPVAGVVLGTLFRAESRSLFGRLKKDKIGSAELEFEATVRALATEIKGNRFRLQRRLSFGTSDCASN